MVAFGAAVSAPAAWCGRASCSPTGLVELAGFTQTDQGTVLGFLLEGAQRLQQDSATRKRWQGAGEALLATRAEERRVLQARKRGVAHVGGQGRNGALVVTAPEEGEMV